MDEQWAKQVLKRWLRSVRAASGGGSGDWLDLSGEIETLLEYEDQVARTVARIVGGNPPVLVQRVNEFYLLGNGEQTVRRALGRLQTDQETRRKLGSAAPRMSADGLHPVIWQAAGRLWEDGHYAQAVQRAATLLSAEIRDRVGRHDLQDVALMNEVFSTSPPSSGRLRLRWPGDDLDLTVKSMRDGIRSYAVGCFQAIRNPATHSGEALSEQEGLEQLAALSTLARWTDACELVGADEG